MNENYFTEMKRCKTDWLDDIFYGWSNKISIF